jgi:hypothetical protein
MMKRTEHQLALVDRLSRVAGWSGISHLDTAARHADPSSRAADHYGMCPFPASEIGARRVPRFRKADGTAFVLIATTR